MENSVWIEHWNNLDKKILSQQIWSAVFFIQEKSNGSLNCVRWRTLSWMHPSWHKNDWFFAFERPFVIKWVKPLDSILLYLFAILLISNGNDTNISLFLRMTKNFMMIIYGGMIVKFCRKSLDKVLALFIGVRVCKSKLYIGFLVKLEGKGKLGLIEAIVLKWTKNYVFFDLSF